MTAVPHVPMLLLNLYDRKMYGVETTDEQTYGKIYVYDLQADTLEVIREEPASYLQVADGILYFTDDSDHTLRKMDVESGEETILVDEPVYFPVVYKDIIVFQLDSDKESLYSIPKDGGEMAKLNDVRSYEPMVCQDRIYYKALDKSEQYTVRGMDLDGSNEEIILPVGTLQMNLYNGILYYVLQDTPNMVFYIDLSDEANYEANGIIEAYNLDGSAVMREIWYVLNDEGMDADIVDEKVMELLESAGSKERAKIMEALREISASA